MPAPTMLASVSIFPVFSSYTAEAAQMSTRYGVRTYLEMKIHRIQIGRIHIISLPVDLVKDQVFNAEVSSVDDDQD